MLCNFQVNSGKIFKMKKISCLILLSFVLLGMSIPPVRHKINLVIITKNLDKLNLKSIDKNLSHNDVCDFFTYEMKFDSTCVSPKTEVYFKENILGTIYGIPNKDFLCQILPLLEEQISEIDKISKIGGTLDK